MGSQHLNFFPAPYKTPVRAFAALMFPWSEGSALVCQIEGRGWCIPSGRVEPGETSLEAALRESAEESGASLRGVQYIGCYRISEHKQVRWADCFAGWVTDLSEIQVPTESHGRRFMTFAELEECYHLWNPLTELVFRHSLEVLQRAVQDRP